MLFSFSAFASTWSSLSVAILKSKAISSCSDVLVLDEGLESLSLDCLSLLTLPRDNNVLKFFILCNPAFTLGYIQFVLIVNTVDKSFYNQIVERIYEELGENVLCQPPVIDPDNVITVILFSQDIFTANGISKR